MPILYIFISFSLTAKQTKLERLPLEGFNGLAYYLQVRFEVYSKVLSTWVEYDLNMG